MTGLRDCNKSGENQKEKTDAGEVGEEGRRKSRVKFLKEERHLCNSPVQVLKRAESSE